jgi:hypothetical protein
MIIELGYQFYIHACFGNYLGNSFLQFFLFFRFFRLDCGSNCPDGKVDSSGRPFSLSGWAYFLRSLTCHYVRTSLKFCPDGEPCRVISHSPRAAAFSFCLFVVLFVILCIFFVLFMHISHVHVSSLQFISTPGVFLYSFTNLF